MDIRPRGKIQSAPTQKGGESYIEHLLRLEEEWYQWLRVVDKHAITFGMTAALVLLLVMVLVKPFLLAENSFFLTVTCIATAALYGGIMWWSHRSVKLASVSTQKLWEKLTHDMCVSLYQDKNRQYAVFELFRSAEGMRVRADGPLFHAFHEVISTVENSSR